MVRITVGVSAHPRYIATAHEDQKFGFSLAGGSAAAAVSAVLAEPALELLGLHSHIGSQIFDTAAFEVAARRALGCTPRFATSTAWSSPSSASAAGSAWRTRRRTIRSRPTSWQPKWRRSSERTAQTLGVAVPRVSVEPGRAIAGPSTLTLYEIGTVKPVELDAGSTRTYVAVDGGMSDNIRTALYGADYSCTWPAAAPASAGAGAGRRQALAATSS